MEKKKGFKVVRDCDGSFWSITSHYPVHYPVGKAVGRPFDGEREIGPLAVFTEINLAMSFIYKYGYLEEGYRERTRIFECEYVPSEDTKLYRFECGEMIFNDNLPPGTELADEVTLIKEYFRP